MSDKTNDDTVNSDTNVTTFKGMPGLVLLPSHMYKFEIVTNDCLLSVPISGKFSEMYPDFFKEAKKNETTDKFEVVSDKSGIKYLFSTSLIEVLFADSKYPALENDEIFAIGSMFLSEEILYINGAVLKLV